MSKSKSKIPEKQKISVKIDGSWLDFDYVSLDSVIESCQRAKEEYTAQGYTDLNLQPVQDCGCYGSCDCGSKPRLFGMRLETDAEFEARCLKEIEAQARIDERERAEFERLSKRFGKT